MSYLNFNKTDQYALIWEILSPWAQGWPIFRKKVVQHQQTVLIITSHYPQNSTKFCGNVEIHWRRKNSVALLRILQSTKHCGPWWPANVAKTTMLPLSCWEPAHIVRECRVAGRGLEVVLVAVFSASVKRQQRSSRTTSAFASSECQLRLILLAIRYCPQVYVLLLVFDWVLFSCIAELLQMSHGN